jgi:hypothetical protein
MSGSIAILSFRVVIALRPTQPNKSPSSPPRKRGSMQEAVDSRLRGNDVVGMRFEGAKRASSADPRPWGPRLFVGSSMIFVRPGGR